MTDTIALKTWWDGSKVADIYGRPLVVYHGSPERFSEFDEGEWYFFAEDEDVARTYAHGPTGCVHKVLLKATNVPEEVFPSNFAAADFLSQHPQFDGARYEDTDASGAYGGHCWVVRSSDQIRILSEPEALAVQALPPPDRRSMVLYHGTDTPFTAFDPMRPASGCLWLCEYWGAAKSYGQHLLAVDVVLNKPATESDALAAAAAVGVDRETLHDEYPLKILEQHPEALSWLRRRGFDAVLGNDTNGAGDEDVRAALILDEAAVRRVRQLPPLTRPDTETPMRFHELLREEPAFNAFVSSGWWSNNLSTLDAENNGPGMVYLDDTLIGRTFIDGEAVWNLVLGNCEYVGSLQELETLLFGFAVRERAIPGHELDESEKQRLCSLAEQLYEQRDAIQRRVEREAVAEIATARVTVNPRMRKQQGL